MAKKKEKEELEGIDDVIASLKAEFKGTGLISTASGVEPKRQRVPSVGLNSALGGGFGYGRQVSVWGTKSAGKSSFCLQMIADAQKDGKICAYVDAEKTLSASWAEKLGVDVEQLIYVKSNTIPEVTNAVCKLMEKNVDIIVLDSINALLPRAQLQDNGDLKPMGENNQMGSFSKDMSDAVTRMNMANENTLLVLIAQGRMDLGGYGAPMKMTGGNAVQYYSSQIVKLWSSKSEKQAVTTKTYVGNKVVERVVGRQVLWTVENNKLGRQWDSGTYEFIFEGEHIGIDNISEIVDVAVEQGTIEKAGAWFKYGEEKFHGKNDLIEWVKNNPSAYAKIEGEIYAGQVSGVDEEEDGDDEED